MRSLAFQGFFQRLWAMTVKELAQVKRDRLTFATMMLLPLLQIVLFGYAINTDPRHLPTALLVREQGPISRAILASLSNTGYFAFDQVVQDPAQLDTAIRSGKVQIAIEFPPHFERDVRKGLHPSILVVADASDPAATSNAVAALAGVGGAALARELNRSGMSEAPAKPFNFVVHRRYNPEWRTQLNILPGLLGVVLTMSMTVFTALAITRELERDTMESLLSMPIRPVEIMLGKILPFIGVGFAQAVLIVIASKLLFSVPVEGSLLLLSVATLMFILVNLTIGYTFSTLARTQLQAVQMIVLFYLPNMLLSGFMFPFRGMPPWAQWVGEFLPLTHFLRLVRGIMLKGSGASDMILELVVLFAFFPVVMLVALARFRQTLD